MSFVHLRSSLVILEIQLVKSVFFDAFQGVIDQASGSHEHFTPGGATMFDEFWWE